MFFVWMSEFPAIRSDWHSLCLPSGWAHMWAAGGTHPLVMPGLLRQGFQLRLVRRIVPVDGAVGETVLQPGQAELQPLLPEIGITLIPVRIIGPAGLQEMEPGALAFRHEAQADLGLLLADMGELGGEIPAEAEQIVGHDGHHPAAFATALAEGSIGSEIDLERAVGLRHHQALGGQEAAQAALCGPGAPDIVDVSRHQNTAFYLLVIHKSVNLKPVMDGTQAV